MSFTILGTTGQLPDGRRGPKNGYVCDGCSDPVILYAYAGDYPTLKELAESHHCPARVAVERHIPPEPRRVGSKAAGEFVPFGKADKQTWGKAHGPSVTLTPSEKASRY